ncbi:MAG TPA: aminodeoxychorismate synthase component I, partial [Polyangiaceae bacterium]|nr:aminodeoxychorismate synthase component I [Polyangiaceae bacterium]
MVDPAPPFALFENHRAGSGRPASHLFWAPVEQIRTDDGAEVAAALDRVQDRARAGLFVCGYLTYEAGYSLVEVDRPFLRRAEARARSLPLVSFFAFRRHEALDVEAAGALLRRIGGARPCAVYDVELGESREAHAAKIARIHEYIRAGDTYQVNHTFRCRLRYEGTAASLYAGLRDRQPVEHGAFLDFPEARVLSVSPELFVRKEGDVLTCKPMKGTAARGRTPDEDAAIARALGADPKTQSENVMIVDLVRSDIGRLASPGSVRVTRLFEVQTFGTVHQVTSTIEGEVARSLSVADAFRRLFPCGSVTGAPKPRTMQIIEDLEDEPRGVYTGAVGRVMPDGDFDFNVAIRTLVSTVDGVAELGIGSGIVHESEASSEYAESVLKARFATGLNDAFQLVETMRFDAGRGEPARLEHHLRRIVASARTFGFCCEPTRLLAAIAAATSGAPPGPHKLRLTLGQDGAARAALSPLDDGPTDRRRVVVSPHAIDSRSVFQRHKTTVRELYDRELARADLLGAYDVLFLNERGEVAECARHNVFVEIDGEWLTPPLSAGALPGVQRGLVLADPSMRAREAVLR